MTVARGWSAEADKLLDYLVRDLHQSFYAGCHQTLRQEHGIFDAIEKQYLRSLIFAIYLVRGLSFKNSTDHQ